MMKMAFSEVASRFCLPYLFSCNPKPLFKRNETILSCFTRQNPRDFFEPFRQPLRSAILNKKKALGTRLVYPMCVLEHASLLCSRLGRSLVPTRLLQTDMHSFPIVWDTFTWTNQRLAIVYATPITAELGILPA